MFKIQYIKMSKISIKTYDRSFMKKSFKLSVHVELIHQNGP